MPTQEQEESPLKTSLRNAASLGDIEDLEALLNENTININLLNDALIEATSNGHLNIVTLLLEHGASPEAKDCYLPESPAVVIAQKCHHDDIVQVLLQYGASLDPETEQTCQL